MYQFTTTTILNSNLDSNGSTAKFAGTSTAFTVTRVGKFLKDNIVSVYKRPYAAGVKEIAKVTIPTITAGLVARVTVDVRLSQNTNSEYANTYLYFKKPVVVEVIATGTAATDATALKNQINGLKDKYGFSYITATTNGADLIVTATDNYQRFHSIVVEKEKASVNSLIQPEYENVSASTFSVTTPGKVGFGDDAYMIKSIMIPTQENTRYFGINVEERPVLGGNYTQFTLRYKVAKQNDGIVAGGDSITTHVFYVKSDLVAAFESALTTTKAIDSLNAAAPETVVTTKDITVNAAVGAITAVSSDTDVATVKVANNVVTVTGVADGEVNITITDESGNYIVVPVTVNVA